jgi:hypothetical protein
MIEARTPQCFFTWKKALMGRFHPPKRQWMKVRDPRNERASARNLVLREVRNAIAEMFPFSHSRELREYERAVEVTIRLLSIEEYNR